MLDNFKSVLIIFYIKKIILIVYYIMSNKKVSKIQSILDKIGVDETHTKKQKHKFDKVRDNTFPKGGYNEMADLLMLPTTKEGYKYLLCIVDLWSNMFDIEPLKNKTAEATLEGMMNIFKRKKKLC
jgi:hypothetical protein